MESRCATRSSSSARSRCHPSARRSGAPRGELDRVAGQRRHAQAGQPRARAAALTLPRRHIPLERVRRFAPSLRSLLIGLCLVAAALGAYALARGTSAFAIQRVVVTGATPAVHRDVRQAVAPLVGTSLLSLHGGGLLRRVDDLPTVLSARYDRAFPHTLRLWVVPERPVAVVRRGRESWLVSARGRVIARIPQGGDPTLARVWVKRVTPLRPGSFVDAQAAGTAAQALALATRFPARIATASL